MTKILLIDDCWQTVSVLNRVLTAAGYHVWATCSSQAGLGMLQREHPDLVITDIHMPTPDGIDLLRFAESRNLNVPFIVMSGEGWTQNQFPVARYLGAVFTLSKPVVAQQLLESVEAALDLHWGSEIVKTSRKPS